MPSPAERAETVFSHNFNCSQSVFSAFAARFGMDEKSALKLASPFGGGVARRGEMCGAVSGALLALGLARGADTPAGKEAIYHLAQDFLNRFETRHGSLLCRDLIDCDISSPLGWQNARESGKLTTICPALVRDAAELVQELLGPD
jgi:C_GCAxxG_C_C family probable redox protein